MFKIPKPEYTAEFKELAVKRVKDGQGVGAVACRRGPILVPLAKSILRVTTNERITSG